MEKMDSQFLNRTSPYTHKSHMDIGDNIIIIIYEFKPKIELYDSFTKKHE